METRRQLIVLGLAGLAGSAPRALAHGEQPHAGGAPAKKEQKPWGIAGDAKAVRRTVTLRMSDAMRFAPERFDAKLGETLRLVVHNDGQVMHELVLGTKAELDAHAELMQKHPGMEHDEPHMTHVGPGKRGEIVWRFNRAGEFFYACLIAGHYQAGMIGRVRVTPAG